MVRCVLPLILVLTTGCAIAPPPISPGVPITVKVPIQVPVYCEPPRLARPALPIAALKPSSPPADTLRAYAATVVLLKGAVEERDAVLAGCMKPATTVANTMAAAPKANSKDSGTDKP